ncbi:radical SAM/SPASM domain-containing protein [Butyrivibrio sp. LC3010]|uniref:radical SAM/SPASM domain-containing protein n=1 Tax=Butyrivibrio sp. LC3010 TaxID=1280680 RepID=UPI0004023BCD|nr:radical SAM/SPASM domain-containing protein [Butyrivibrio sp. LC3010]
MKKYIIFGAGALGNRAVAKFGRDNISFFIDNNPELCGKYKAGIEIKDIHTIIDSQNDSTIVIASRHWRAMEKQLNDLGIEDYVIYSQNAYFDTPDIIYNPYLDRRNDTDGGAKVLEINSITQELYKNGEISFFNHIEIETVNRCNGICSFCPVNARIDSRNYSIMDPKLFEKIINELEEYSYSGRIALFSNNEPLLDERIIDFHKYAREHLPKARMHLCTNGTLLTVEKYKSLMKYLDELIIDNYNQQLEIIPSVKKILEYCKGNSDLEYRTTIVLRKTEEIMTSRGGDAPNVKNIEKYPNASCILPFTQMVVRPDGKVSLCCNDALGKMTMGDLNTDSLENIWNGEKFEQIRKKILDGRKNIERCKYCDTLYLI